jgi:glycosyltransferase involved in cell wall biosynthesis
LRTFCPDALLELLLHLESTFDPHVLLAEYVFMTRGFSLLRPGLLKVVDTIDVWSTRQSKVAQYGIEDSLAITPEMESELLNRADLLIAIQPDEAQELHKLAPKRKVISIGVDFTLLEDVQPPPAGPNILLVASDNAMNVKGLNDFLRFAWPLVRDAVPEAELRVIGAVGNSVDPSRSGVRILGRVDDLDSAYADARVVINPALAGTGLKIKTVEALCHLRPVVLWPAGVAGLAPDIQALFHVASNWFDFGCRVIELLRTPDSAGVLIERRSELARRFAPETVYAPLSEMLDSR